MCLENATQLISPVKPKGETNINLKKDFFFCKIFCFFKDTVMVSLTRIVILFGLFAQVLSVKFYVKQGELKCIGDDVRKVL